MDEIKIGSVVTFIRDYRLYTVIELFETIYKIKKANIKDNETGDVVNDILLSELELAPAGARL